MALDKTIENLDRQRSEKLALGKLEDANALGLGREALWEIQQHRIYPNYIISNPLPGETKEGD